MYLFTWVALMILFVLFFVFPMRRKQAAVCKHINQKHKKDFYKFGRLYGDPCHRKGKLRPFGSGSHRHKS